MREEEFEATRIVCSRCRTEMTPENRATRATDSDDEQIVCGFCGSELFGRVCEDHQTPDVSH